MTVLGPCLPGEGVSCSRGLRGDRGMGGKGGCCTDGLVHACTLQKLFVRRLALPNLIKSGYQSGSK